MGKTKKKRTPSRIRYEQTHPTVSSRVSREFYDTLQAAKEAEGLSNTDILKVGLGLVEVKVSKEKEARSRGYEEGFDEGYEEADNLYKVTYPCRRCGKTLEVTSANAKKAIKTYMLEHGWGHTNCTR